MTILRKSNFGRSCTSQLWDYSHRRFQPSQYKPPAKTFQALSDRVEWNMAYVARPTSCALLLLYFISIFTSGTRADIIEDCDNGTSCIGTFADIYNALASDENNFNIVSALYPAKKPSSILVFINMYGKDGSRKADNSIPDVKNYTWSLSCLYAAFPAAFLEILSLGTILVTPRMQSLSITIPYFCCNVTAEKRNRMVVDVLAMLQDLAVTPNLQDPQLNSAECVTNDHKPNIEATEHGPYLLALLYCSFLCVVLLSPLSILYALGYLKKHSGSEECVLCINSKCSTCYKCEFCNKREEPLKRSAALVCGIVLVIEVVVWVAVCSVYSTKGNLPSEFYENSTKVNLPSGFYAIIALIGLQSVIEFILLQCCKSFKDWKTGSICGRALLIVSTKLVLCHLCWVAIGIMLNPTWGLSALLIISFFLVLLFYFMYQICSVNQCMSYLFFRRFGLCAAGFFGVSLAIVPPALAGRSFYGRETADDILKTAVLYAIGTVSWLYFKSIKSSPNISKCAKAAKEAAAKAKALAEKISVPQCDGIASATTAAVKAQTLAAGALAEAALAAAATAGVLAEAAVAAGALADAAAAAEAVTNALAKVGDSDTEAMIAMETSANEN